MVKNIYFSDDIDQSDYSDARTYYHDASGTMDLMHLGAYYDPGMEFGGFFDRLQDYTPTECEAEFDRPFSGTGIRIVKSHVFAHQIDFLREHWPDCPVVTVHRPDDACLGWWVKCGHFDITYPSYDYYYRNLRTMGKIIHEQNQDITQALLKHGYYSMNNNHALCKRLNIKQPPEKYYQDYTQSDIGVRVIC